MTRAFRLSLASAGLAAAIVVTGCSATPLVTRERMTLGEANVEGMECRQDKPITTNIPRTICASPEAWAKYDERARRATEELIAEGRKAPNVGGFNRPN
jgi:hypothetical protein